MQYRTIDHTYTAQKSAPASLNLLTLHITQGPHTTDQISMTQPLVWLWPAASQHCSSGQPSVNAPSGMSALTVAATQQDYFLAFSVAPVDLPYLPPAVYDGVWYVTHNDIKVRIP